jgi:alpha-beta hydrolase superfamily lysophospholipase
MAILMRVLAIALLATAPAQTDPEASGQPKRISFRTEDGATIVADAYGTGERGVVLAHGGRFNKESWKPQAEAIARAGFRVLAIDFRGYGDSSGPGQQDVFTAPLHLDVLGAVQYLRTTGATSVSLIGGSLGGWAAANAAASEPAAINRLILIGSDAGRTPERITAPKLFIVTRDDTSGSGLRLPGIRESYERAREPKEILVLEGSAHAQFMFQTELASRVMDEVLKFLAAPQ